MSFKNLLDKHKKLIIYCSSPIFNTWPQKFKLKEFKNYGLDIELWSTEEIFYSPKNINNALKGSDDYVYKDLEIIKIKHINELENKIAKLDKKTLILVMSLGSFDKNNFINPDLDIFNKYKVNYILHHLNPNFNVPNLWFQIKFNLKLLKKKYYNRKKKPILIIGTGTEGRSQVSKIYGKKFKYKSLPSFNVIWHKVKPLFKDKIIIFVEENVDLSPDSALFGGKNKTHDIDGYYNRINKVFEKIENWTGYRVVVGASGKYDYKFNPFKNRQIIYRKTSNLIQNAEIVLGHNSSGLEQAIVDYKPLIILKDNGFIELKNKLIDNFAKSYKLNSIWTNKLTKNYFDKNIKVDQRIYNEIIKKYLKEDGVRGSFIENIASVFHEI